MVPHYLELIANARRSIGPNLELFLRTRQPVIWLLAPMVGLGVGGAAVLFRLAIGLVQWSWLRDMSENVTSAAAEQPWWVIVLAPAAGGLVVGLLLRYVLTARRTGSLADVIEARTASARGLGTASGSGERRSNGDFTRLRCQRRSRRADRTSRRDPGCRGLRPPAAV